MIIDGQRDVLSGTSDTGGGPEEDREKDGMTTYNNGKGQHGLDKRKTVKNGGI